MEFYLKIMCFFKEVAAIKLDVSTEKPALLM